MRPRQSSAPVPTDEPSSATAVAACAVSIISGWATSVVATDLIAGWWHTDRLFCIAVAFLALVFAAATVSGVIMLLQRRRLGRYLITAGAVVALLTYGGVFIAGARVGVDRARAAAAADRQRGAGAARTTSAGCRPAERVLARLFGLHLAQWLELADRGVVVHQLDPPGAAEVDQRHRRFADAGDLLDPAQPVLVVGHPVAGLPAPTADVCPPPERVGAARGVPNRPAPLTGALNDGAGSVRRQSMSSCGISRRNRDSGLSIGCPQDDRTMARLR